jgi:hypothetical protein
MTSTHLTKAWPSRFVVLAFAALATGQLLNACSPTQDGKIQNGRNQREDQASEAATIISPADATFSQGLWFLADESADEIVVVDSTGREVRRFGRRGRGPGEFLMPTAISVFQGKTIVADLGNQRLATFDSSGKHIEAISLQAQCVAGRVQALRSTAESLFALRECPQADGILSLRVDEIELLKPPVTVMSFSLRRDAAGRAPVVFSLFDVSDSLIALGDGQTGCFVVQSRSSSRMLLDTCLDEYPAIQIPDSVQEALKRRAKDRLIVSTHLPKALDLRFFQGGMAVLVPQSNKLARWMLVPMKKNRNATDSISLTEPLSGRSFWSEQSVLYFVETEIGRAHV